ncbi:purine-binding chemotaxis protein CheW [Aggregicoccus sp. 17bor-14]|nr:MULTISPECIES: chemotaxis protein CheW [Myxococcaceae]MBF5045106.1 purine-binding chemotaxis protein CheW [Simulacricoccus sp. 17bor-14]MRI90848.1 purine-binding chemotaxis protein CheW [Aggregicoccus sp. 17bor-14]
MEAPAPVQQFLSFRLGADTCAVPILRVHEILQFETVTPVPNTPAFIRGVLDRRGSALPVVDLAVKLGRPQSPLSKWSCVVVLEVAVDPGPPGPPGTPARGETVLLGALVDTVEEVLDFGAGDIQPPPALGAGLRLEYLQGLGKRDKQFVLLLDIDRVLTASELELAGTITAPEAAPDAATEASAEAPAEPAQPSAPSEAGEP